MKNTIFWILFIAVSLSTYFMGSIVQYKHDLSDGETATTWESNYNDAIKQYLNELTANDELEYKLTPTPTPYVINKTQEVSTQSHGMNCQPETGVWPPGQLNCTSY